MVQQQLHAIFSGHVQGVGFRYTTHNIASHFAVKGYVQNLDNGTVELVAEGEKDELERFLVKVQQKMVDNINKTGVHWYPPTGQFTSFGIRR